MSDLRINADYHTHTVYSHGKGTILDNVLTAKKLGLKAIAITDHGFGQPYAGLTRKKFYQMKKEVDEIRKEITDIEVLLGVEANLINMDGEIDYVEDLFDEMDIVLSGFHLTATQRKLKSLITTAIPGILGKMHITSKAQKQKNTKAFVNMIKKYRLDAITHPGYILDIDYDELGKVCADYGTLIEISSRHNVPSCDALETLLKYDVNFIVNSDAHKLEQIGKCEYALNLVEKYDIKDRVFNIGEKASVFKRIK